MRAQITSKQRAKLLIIASYRPSPKEQLPGEYRRDFWQKTGRIWLKGDKVHHRREHMKREF